MDDDERVTFLNEHKLTFLGRLLSSLQAARPTLFPPLGRSSVFFVVRVK